MSIFQGFPEGSVPNPIVQERVLSLSPLKVFQKVQHLQKTFIETFQCKKKKKFIQNPE